jgi:hypothetical protein
MHPFLHGSVPDAMSVDTPMYGMGPSMGMPGFGRGIISTKIEGFLGPSGCDAVLGFSGGGVFCSLLFLSSSSALSWARCAACRACCAAMDALCSALLAVCTSRNVAACCSWQLPNS